MNTHAPDAGAGDGMTFLNDAKSRYPAAISFAAGRPATEYLSVADVGSWVARFVEHDAVARAVTPDRVWTDLGQYSTTHGVVCGVIADHLRTDEGFDVSAADVLVTNGVQEGMLIALLTLFAGERDVVFVEDPTYVGITGAAAVGRVRVAAVPAPLAENLPGAIRAVEARGLRPRGVYVIPDHGNPTGDSLSLADRHQVLALADRHDLLVLEDSPYRRFAYDAPPLPTLWELDNGRRVIHLGTFAKTLVPGLRVGWIVPHRQFDSAGRPPIVALTETKSFVSVATSPVAQAAAAGLLLGEGGSLADRVGRLRDVYRARRDQLLASLDEHCGPAPGRPDVTWTRPAGGFFLRVYLPGDFGEAELRACAADHGVIVCPMRFFSGSARYDRQVRLAFADVTADQIAEGVRRFAGFLRVRYGSPSTT